MKARLAAKHLVRIAEDEQDIAGKVVTDNIVRVREAELTEERKVDPFSFWPRLSACAKGGAAVVYSIAIKWTATGKDIRRIPSASFESAVAKVWP